MKLMKNIVAALAACAGLACTANAADVVISTMYGGGGAGSPTYYQYDVIELHNKSQSSIGIGGWSVQYASAAGTSWTVFKIPAGASIPAGGYYLIQLSTSGSTGGGLNPLPTPDLVASGTTGTINASATNAKIALVNNQVALTGACPSGAGIQDFLGYGTANCSEGTALAALTSATAAIRNNSGCDDTDNNAADFTVGSPAVRNLSSPVFVCSGPCTDCNTNGTCDSVDINNAGGVNGVGGALDCNDNGQLDSCELGTATDCDGNGVLDACQIDANPGLDCNHNNRLDSCDITTTPFLDSCNMNGSIDSCEPLNGGPDCNANNVIDCWDLKVGLLTDVDGNGTPDACEGASVAEAGTNGTVQAGCTAPTCTNQIAPGVRTTPNGDAFFNIEGEANVTPTNDNRSYGALRFPVASVTAQFDAQFGAGNWHVTKAYLFLQQNNAAFTLNGTLSLYWSNNDAQDFTPGATINTNTTYQNFATDFADRDLVSTYTFTQGSGTTIGSAPGNGTTESHLLFDAAGSNNTAMTAIAGELNSGSGDITLLISPEADPFVAATYAGRTNNTWRGPSLVVFAESNGGTPGLCEYDLNGDGNVDQSDVDCVISAVAGDPSCVRTDVAVELDKNQDGNVDQGDVDVVVDVVAGGNAPGC